MLFEFFFSSFFCTGTSVVHEPNTRAKGSIKTRKRYLAFIKLKTPAIPFDPYLHLRKGLWFFAPAYCLNVSFFFPPNYLNYYINRFEKENTVLRSFDHYRFTIEGERETFVWLTEIGKGNLIVP